MILLQTRQQNISLNIQNITDIYATSIDYDPTLDISLMFLVIKVGNTGAACQ